MTPEETLKQIQSQTSPLDKNFSLPNGHFPLSEGEIYIIGFNRSDLKFNAFRLTLALSEETMYEYAPDVKITKQHRLIIFKDNKYTPEFGFILYE